MAFGLDGHLKKQKKEHHPPLDLLDYEDITQGITELHL